MLVIYNYLLIQMELHILYAGKTIRDEMCCGRVP